MAAGLREGGFTGKVTLIGAELERPYERPYLSKEFLLGTVGPEKLPLRPAAQYDQLGVDLALGRNVVDLGVDEHRVLLEDGGTIGWDVLCIATGSDSRRLPGLEDAMYLRDLEQAVRVKARIAAGGRLDIVGAGFIGCEVAAVAVQKGCEVTVFEALPQPLVRVLGPDLGAYLADVHRGHGVDLHLNTSSPSADLVAIGSTPRTIQGPDVDGGIVVDEFGHTSIADVFAAGDVTRFFHPLFATRIRVEHFQTSQRQGFAVGRTMAGRPTAYTEVPWFWSDQYDLNIQYAGAGLRWDSTVTRGEIGFPPFTVFYLRGSDLIAAAGVNDHHTIARVRRVMEARKSLTTQQMEDPRYDLRSALSG